MGADGRIQPGAVALGEGVQDRLVFGLLAGQSGAPSAGAALDPGADQPHPDSLVAGGEQHVAREFHEAVVELTVEGDVGAVGHRGRMGEFFQD